MSQTLLGLRPHLRYRVADIGEDADHDREQYRVDASVYCLAAKNTVT